MNVNDMDFLDRVKRSAADLGFELCRSKSWQSIALRPLEGRLPPYAKTDIYEFQTVEAVEQFLRGWSACMAYCNIIGITQNKIAKAEQQYMSKRVFDIMASEKLDNEDKPK